VATLAQWIEGARPRTLPNALAPVIAGTGAAAWLHAAVWWKALLALAVAVAMIIGVNFANDYSDGVRGTDAAADEQHSARGRQAKCEFPARDLVKHEFLLVAGCRSR